MLLHSVMDRVSEHTTNKQKMDEFSMVYYNNLLVGRGGGWQEPGQGSLVCWAAGEGEGGVDPAGGGRAAVTALGLSQLPTFLYWCWHPGYLYRGAA